jgi:hypothetical protein
MNRMSVDTDMTMEERCGIQVEYLCSHHFTRLLTQFHISNNDLLPTITTEEVCTQLVKRVTEEHACSFSTYLLNDPATSMYVGKPQVFIFHAWKYHFQDLRETLLKHFEGERDTYIWLDIFSYNQHDTEEKNFHWWSTIFKDKIVKIGHTVMVFAPWKDPLPLKRAWCLWELFCSDNSKLDVAISPKEEKLFLKDISGETRSEMYKMLASIDVEESECGEEDDKKNIFEAIKDSSSFFKLNNTVIGKLRAWLIKIVEESTESARKVAANSSSEMRSFLRLENVLATLYDREQRREKHVQAVEMFRRNLEERKAAFFADENDRDIWAAKYCLADSIKRDRETKVEAIELLKECLEWAKLHDPDDYWPSVKYTLSDALCSHRKYPEAAQLALELSAYHEQKTNNVDYYNSSQFLLGKIYLFWSDIIPEKLPLAQEIFEKQVEEKKERYGVKHKHTISCKEKLAKVYEILKRYSEAYHSIITFYN